MNDVTIWRYLDFSKYVDVISTSKLFFCRSDHLGDPFEGSWPERHVDRRIDEIRTKGTLVLKQLDKFKGMR